MFNTRNILINNSTCRLRHEPLSTGRFSFTHYECWKDHFENMNCWHRWLEHLRLMTSAKITMISANSSVNAGTDQYADPVYVYVENHLLPTKHFHKKYTSPCQIRCVRFINNGFSFTFSNRSPLLFGCLCVFVPRSAYLQKSESRRNNQSLPFLRNPAFMT